MQEFKIIVLDRPGKDNVVADFLSRIKNEDDDIPVDDSFPVEYLFALSVNTPWFADMENYLATRKLPLICYLVKSGKLLHRVLITLGLVMVFFAQVLI
jgi:hypothetical protein